MDDLKGNNGRQLWKVKYFLFFMCFFVLTFGRFPGLVTRRSNFAKNTWIFFILNNYKSFKTEYIFKNVDYLYIHRVMIWRQKKWGHQKTIFATSGYRYPEVGNIFGKKQNIFLKYFGVLHRGLGAIDSCKNQTSKISC